MRDHTTRLGGTERSFQVEIQFRARWEMTINRLIILLSKLVGSTRLSGLTREASNLVVEGLRLVESMKK